jgi:hypothetical protein
MSVAGELRNVIVGRNIIMLVKLFIRALERDYNGLTHNYV